MNLNRTIITVCSLLILVAGGALLWNYQTYTKKEIATASPLILSSTSAQSSSSLLATSHSDNPNVISPNHYTAFTEELARAKAISTSTIGIQFFGDIMLDRSVAKAMGEKGLDYLFEYFSGPGRGLDPAIDLTVANLEGPFAPTRVKTTKSIAFRFDPLFASHLKRYGFDVVSLANNHTLDMGWSNVEVTHKTLDKEGIGHFGDQLRDGKEFTYIASIPGVEDKIAFIGLNTTDHITPMNKVYAAIKDAKTKARYIIAMMHWGVEYKRISREEERQLARLLLDKGVDAVIGAHPHVVQEAEVYKGKPIFYSLGNFIFDQYFSQETQEGLSVGMILQEGKIKNMYIFPFFGEKSQVHLMEEKRRDEFLQWMNENSRLSGKKFENGRMEL